MENREWHNTDKSSWGDGEWLHEPDKKQWTDQDTGYPCLIVRNRVGALCGYVGVPLDHPYFGKTDRAHTQESSREYISRSSELLEQYGGYDKIPEGALDGIHQPSPNYEEKFHELKCHGGVTFTGICIKATKEKWEKWRRQMIERKPQITQFPNGGVAADWAEYGHLVEDYDAWLKHHEASAICHLVDPNEPEVTWIGFDCSHGGDHSPKMEADMAKWMPGHKSSLGMPTGWGTFETYKNITYVEAECRNLARQLKALATSL